MVPTKMGLLAPVGCMASSCSMEGWFMLLSMEDDKGLVISARQKKGAIWCGGFFMFVLNLAWQMGVQLGRMGVQAGGTTIGPVHWFGHCCGALPWAFKVALTLGPRNFHLNWVH